MKSDDDLSNEAIDFVKQNQKELIQYFVGEAHPVVTPISIFMAGSPGAGKTEFSMFLIDEIFHARENIVCIDPDKIRLWLPCYVPGKAEIVQGAVSTAVNKLHDYVKHESYSFLLDGTFSKIDQVRRNVQQSLAKGRPVLIQYLIQPPEIAWQFTQDREKIDGRNIRRQDFIEQFLSARDTISIIKKEFGNKIQVDLIERNINTKKYSFTFNISNIDSYLPKKYSKNDLENLI